LEDLNHEDGVGGFSIGQHLADIVSFRPDWLSRVSPRHAERVPNVIDESSPTWLGIESIDQLQAAFEAGDAALRDAVVDVVNEGRSFEGVYELYFAYLL